MCSRCKEVHLCTHARVQTNTGTGVESDEDDVPQLDADTVLFEPDPAAFRQGIESAIFEGVKALATPLRLLLCEELRLFVQSTVDEAGPVSEGQDLQTMVVTTASFQSSVDSINALLTDAFDGAYLQTEATDVERYRVTYIENAVWLANTDLQSLLGMPVSEIESQLQQFAGQIRDFADFPDTLLAGCLLIDAKKLKAVLLPSPRECFDSLARLLPLVIAEKMEALHMGIAGSLRRLQKAPSSVDEFTVLMGALSDAQVRVLRSRVSRSVLRRAYVRQGRVDGFAEELSRVDEYAELLARFNIRLDDDTLTAHKMLNSVKSQLTAAMTVSWAARLSNCSRRQCVARGLYLHAGC